MRPYDDADAQAAIAQWGAEFGEDLALRVYTSRLIGEDTSLVLHGGGNTSVKTTATNALGESVEVLAVKGSGWSLGTIEPPGFPMVDLAHCRRLLGLEALADADMVNELRTHLLNAKSPTPSVEALLHAHLPHKFVDHSHADAVLALVDQPAEVAAELCAEAFGPRFAIVPYVMPGFGLARAVAATFDANPDIDGLLLMKHGLFTFGATAKESYERHRAAVEAAEALIAARPLREVTPLLTPAEAEAQAERFEEIAPALRGALSHASGGKGWILEWRREPRHVSFLCCREALEGDWLSRGTYTPDHVIRTKGWPMVLRPGEDAAAAVAAFGERYAAYFERQNARNVAEGGEPKTMLDPLPRVVVLPGLGFVAAGASRKAARVAADIFEHTLDGLQRAMALGEYEPVNEAELFDTEYWSLEQAKLKLGAAAPKALDGKVAVVSGAASGIGLAVARRFAGAGACVALLDRDAEAVARAAAALPGGVGLPVTCDMTDAAAVAGAVRAAVCAFGGVDVVVSNAGAAAPFQGAIDTLAPETLRASFELNFFSHQWLAANAARVLRAQATGGALLFNVSKAALNPGANFGGYSLPKAALLGLVKSYALELGPIGVTSSAVNADRVRTALFTDEFVRQRAQARGIEPDEYFRSNLLKREVRVEDVAESFLHLATASRTTAAVLTVDGGNIAASVR